jgi:hypothetical protein
VELESVSGCFSCTDGFTARITGVSSCYPGPVTISTQESTVRLFTKSVDLRTNVEEFYVSGTTTVSSNSFQLSFCDGERCDEILLDFVASSPQVGDFNDIWLKSNNAIQHESDETENQGWFSKIGVHLFEKGWLNDFTMIAIMVTSLGLLVIFLPPIYRMLSRACRRKKSE